MTTKDIKTPEDLKHYVDGLLNDFEYGITDKEKTSQLIADLIIKTSKAVKQGKKICEI